jgi:hypothetical protein
VAADPLVEADPAAAEMAATGRVAVEEANGDQEPDHEEDGGAERLDVEEDGEKHRLRLAARRQR